MQPHHVRVRDPLVLALRGRHRRWNPYGHFAGSLLGRGGCCEGGIFHPGHVPPHPERTTGVTRVRIQKTQVRVRAAEAAAQRLAAEEARQREGAEAARRQAARQLQRNQAVHRHPESVSWEGWESEERSSTVAATTSALTAVLRAVACWA